MKFLIFAIFIVISIYSEYQKSKKLKEDKEANRRAAQERARREQEEGAEPYDEEQEAIEALVTRNPDGTRKNSEEMMQEIYRRLREREAAEKKAMQEAEIHDEVDDFDSEAYHEDLIRRTREREEAEAEANEMYRKLQEEESARRAEEERARQEEERARRAAEARAREIAELNRQEYDTHEDDEEEAARICVAQRNAPPASPTPSTRRSSILPQEGERTTVNISTAATTTDEVGKLTQEDARRAVILNAIFNRPNF